MSLSEEDLAKVVRDKIQSDLVKQCLEEDGFFAQAFNHDGYATHYYCRLLKQGDPRACKYAEDFFVMCEDGNIMRKCKYHRRLK